METKRTRGAILRNKSMVDIQLRPYQYYFRTVRELRGEDFGVLLSKCAPFQIHPIHEHRNPGVMIALKGDYLEEFESRERSMDCLTARYRPRQTAHSHRVGPKGSLGLHIEFEEGWLSSFGLDEKALARYTYLQSASVQKDSVRLLVSGMRHGDPIDEIEEFAFAVVSQFLTANHIPSGGHWVDHAEEFLRENFASKITLRKVAHEVGISPMHLASAFRKRFQRTITEYVRDLRLVEASKLILNGSHNIGHAAVAVGFSDQAYLARCFRTEFGAQAKELISISESV